MHALLAVLPVVAEKVPETQEEQKEEEPPEYVPTLHIKQTEDEELCDTTEY